MEKLTIESLEWSRIYLIVTFNNDITDDLYLIDENKNKQLICKEYIEKNKLKMPITCAYSDSMISEGKWNFYYQEKLVMVNLSCAKTLDDKNKVYFYKNNDYAYVVSFNIDEQFNLIMFINYMKKNNKPLANDRITSKHFVFHKILVMVLNLFIGLLKLEYKLFSLLSFKKGNRLLFMSETRDKLEGNLLALRNRLVERNLDKNYKFYYSFKKVLSSKKSIWYYLKTVALIARVDYIFIDDYAPIFSFIDLKKTRLIQLWHAGVGFKSVGYSRFGKNGSPHPLVSPHRKYDYAVVASESLIPVYQEVFGLTRKHFIVPGMLRLDGYLDEERIANVKERIYHSYPNIKNKKVILFAPTYRGTGQATAYYDNDQIDLDKLYELCVNNNYIVLFKFHPFIKDKITIKKEYQELLIDVSDYSDINELFYVTDVLITDYSSNIYEYSLFEKPIIFFDYDLEQYEILRGVHNSLEDSPGNVCKTFDEVLDILKNQNYDISKVKKFKNENIAYQDSKSCDRLIKILFDE